MDDELLKLECLKVALESWQNFSPEEKRRADDALTLATRIFDWTKGRNHNDIIGGGAAKVVGKDGDLGKFKDYVKD